MPRKLSRSFISPSSSSLSTTLSASSIPPSLSDTTLPLPKLIIFDLDYTLWPFWVDTHVSPPLKPGQGHASATDRTGEDFAFYADVPSVLQHLPHVAASSVDAPPPIKIGVASRTSAPSLAKDLLKMLHLPAAEEGDKPRRAVDVFDGGMEIYPGSKVRHMEMLHKRTGIRYEDMLFFDDESRNQDTEKLGVTMRLVRDGVSWAEVEAGVDDWRRRRGFNKSHFL